MSLATHAVLALLALAPVQDPPAPAPEPQSPAPVVVPQQPGGAMMVGGPTLESVAAYRGYDACPYVRKLEDVRKLDLSKVDLHADVVARINGHEVTRDELDVWVAFTAGQHGVTAAQLVRLTQRLAEQIVADGGKPDLLAVTEAELEEKLKFEEDTARAQGEEGLKAYQTQIQNTLGSMERYREYVRAHLLAEKILLPPIVKAEEGAEPQALPVEAAVLLDDQPQLRDYLNEAYLKGNELPPLFRTQFLKMLVERLVDHADIVYAIESPLPAGTYMTIHGEPVPVADILEFVPDDRTARENALQLLLTYRAIDDALREQDALLDAEEFEAEFTAHEAEYAGTLFPLRNLIQLRGFTNMPEYREYYRRRAAFQRMIGDSITEEELREHHSKYGRLFYENGKVSVLSLWSSLVEAEKEAQGSDAWEVARQRIERAARAIREEGRPFEEVQQELGHAQQGVENGRLAMKLRNELRQAFGETEYTIFRAGYSLADDIFYNRVENEVVGPVRIDETLMPGMKQLMGYALVKALDFRKTQALKSFEEQRVFVTNDYLDLRFIHFSHECLKNADIELTTTGT